jgi:hypothetical protein
VIQVEALRLSDEDRGDYFNRAVLAGLAKPEIARERESAGIDFGELLQAVEGRADAAWAAVQDEEAQLVDVLTEQKEEQSTSLVPDVALKSSSVSAPLADRVERVTRILESALVDKGVLPLLRDEINKRLDESFELVLRIEGAPGLAIMANDDLEVPTSSEAEVANLLRRMPSASIGIAGPRGAGKTTLINRFAAGRATDSSDPPVAVVVSAPVDYEPRDFLLYLFERFTDVVAGPEPVTERSSPGMSSRTIVLAAFWGGIAAIVLGVFALIATALSWSPHVNRGWIVGALLVLVGGVAILAARRIFRIAAPRPELSLSRNGRQDLGSGVRLRATQLRRQIKFQQSFTRGWSGSLTLPASLELGTESSRTLTEQQLSFPAIVDLFKSFVREITVDDKLVLIGIDEMDKIEAREDAHRFLNDIKAIFGINRCYYLVSISEDAMSGFERRGLPFRDAFDSAFDEVVRVSFLKIEDTRRFLGRRVIGLSVPFVYLCHCASGGLARDVIRVAREIAAHADRPETERTVFAVCRSLIGGELIRKCDAVSLAARTTAIEPELGDFVRWTKRLRELPPEPVALDAHCVIYPSSLLGEGASNGDARAAERARLVALASELRGYTYFAATVLQFFDESLDRQRLEDAQRSADPNKRIEALAEARQLFGMNRRIAWERVSEFRRAWGTEPVAMEAEERQPA